VVDPYGVREGEARPAQDVQDRLVRGQFVGPAGDPAGRQRGGLRMGDVRRVDAQTHLAQIVPPLPRRRPPLQRLADQGVADGQRQLVHAAEVAVERARVGVQASARRRSRPRPFLDLLTSYGSPWGLREQ
jgi:hypothetical protein